jgi:hypothetical protein
MKKGYKYLLSQLLDLPGTRFIAGQLRRMFQAFMHGCLAVIFLALFVILHLSLFNVTRSHMRRLRE